MGKDTFPDGGSEVLVGHRLPSEAEDGKIGRQQTIEQEVIERRDQSAARQVARSAEDDQCTGLHRSQGFLRRFNVDARNRRHVCILPLYDMSDKRIASRRRYPFSGRLAMERTKTPKRAVVTVGTGTSFSISV